MTRTAFILDAFTPEQRSLALAHLQEIFGPNKNVDQFLTEISEQIDIYNKLGKPFAIDGNSVSVFEELGTTAARFSLAIGCLSSDMRGLLQQNHIVAVRKRGGDPGTASQSGRDYREFLESAQLFAKSTADYSKKLRSRRQPRRVAEQSLIHDIALSYCNTFGERPSAAEEGRFVRAIRMPLELAGVQISLGDEWLKTIFSAPSIREFPAPKRGQK